MVYVESGVLPGTFSFETDGQMVKVTLQNLLQNLGNFLSQKQNIKKQKK